MVSTQKILFNFILSLPPVDRQLELGLQQTGNSVSDVHLILHECEAVIIGNPVL